MTIITIDLFLFVCLFATINFTFEFLSTMDGKIVIAYTVKGLDFFEHDQFVIFPNGFLNMTTTCWCHSFT